MRRWAFVFLVIAAIMAVASGSLSSGTDALAEVLFFIYLGVFTLVLLVSLVAGDQLPR